MNFAEDPLGNRIEPAPGIIGICSLCKAKVRSRCGEINQWHFSHIEKEDCDKWGEGETYWHRQWKSKFYKEEQEVIIGNHRADIKIKDLVIELQLSSISPDEIREREEYYKNMIWIFKISDDNLSIRNTKFEEGKLIKYKDNFRTFRWKHPKKTIWTCKKQIFLDFETDTIFKIGKIYPNIPCGGYGWIMTKEEFVRMIRNGRT